MAVLAARPSNPAGGASGTDGHASDAFNLGAPDGQHLPALARYTFVEDGKPELVKKASAPAAVRMEVVPSMAKRPSTS